MKLHLQRSGYFHQDFDTQYRWYLNKGGAELADRYLEAVAATLNALVSQPGLGRLRNFKSPTCADCDRFASERHLFLI
jgi:plasmid stabilization system protein ParE